MNGANCSDMWRAINCFPSPADVLTRTSIRSAARTTNPESRWWDTSKKAFYLNERPESNRYALCFQPFSNQISSYSLFDSERLVWQTEDRSWAVFMMGCLATQGDAIQLHGKTIVSANPMPLCLANLVIQRGAGVVGFEEGEHNRRWVYMLDDIKEIWNWLNEWGLGSKVGTASSALVSWLNSYGHSNRANAVNRAQTLRRRY